MKIIRRSNITGDLLRINISKEKEYRLNTCVLLERISDGMLLCNAITGELILLSEKEEDAVNNLPGRISECLSELVEHNFIVPVDYNEKQIIAQLRLILNKKLSGYYRNYVVLPTTYCNAHCFYCYESDIRHLHMSEDTARQLVDFIEKHYDGNKVAISWFGGEPLIGRRIIKRICDDLKNRNISYESKMVSNGVLFDKQIIKEAASDWNLRLVQITLDGTEIIYNQTKAYANVSGNPYTIVLQNIEDLLNEGINVTIRLNLDRHNRDDLRVLINELDDLIKDKRLLNVYVSVLNEDTGYSPIHHEEGEYENLWNYAAELENLIIKKNMKSRKPGLPHLLINSCMADGNDQLSCSPEGILGKCEHFVYKHTVGSLTDGIQDSTTINWWREKEEYEICEGCPIQAACIKLKNCPVGKHTCSEKEVSSKVKSYKKKMRDIFYESIMNRDCEGKC